MSERADDQLSDGPGIYRSYVLGRRYAKDDREILINTRRSYSFGESAPDSKFFSKCSEASRPQRA